MATAPNTPPEAPHTGWPMFWWWAVVIVIVLLIALALGFGGRHGGLDTSVQQENSHHGAPRH